MQIQKNNRSSNRTCFVSLSVAASALLATGCEGRQTRQTIKRPLPHSAQVKASLPAPSTQDESTWRPPTVPQTMQARRSSPPWMSAATEADCRPSRSGSMRRPGTATSWTRSCRRCYETSGAGAPLSGRVDLRQLPLAVEHARRPHPGRHGPQRALRRVYVRGQGHPRPGHDHGQLRLGHGPGSGGLGPLRQSRRPTLQWAGSHLSGCQQHGAQLWHHLLGGRQRGLRRRNLRRDLGGQSQVPRPRPRTPRAWSATAPR